MLYRSSKDKLQRRIWEIDLIRGIALILMIYFHLVFDLNEIYGLPFNYSSGINFYIGKISAITFIFVAGISGAFSKNNVKRGLKVICIALIVTAVTHIYGKGMGVKFGILHFLGLCMILYPLLSKLKSYMLIVLSFIIFLLNLFVIKITISHNAFFIFGIISNSFQSSDYYPLIPWLGFFTLGIAMYKFIYNKTYTYKEKMPKSNKSLPLGNKKLPDNFVNRIGRNTMIIYILHQPVIILLLELIALVKGKG